MTNLTENDSENNNEKTPVTKQVRRDDESGESSKVDGNWEEQ